jgi:hypothetical protein
MFLLKMGEPLGGGDDFIGGGSFPAARFRSTESCEEQLLALGFEHDMQLAAWSVFDRNLGGNCIERVHAQKMGLPGIGEGFGRDDTHAEAGERARTASHSDERDRRFACSVPDFLDGGSEGFGGAGFRSEDGFGDERVTLEQRNRTGRRDGFNRYSPFSFRLRIRGHTKALSRIFGRKLATRDEEQAIIGIRSSLFQPGASRRVGLPILNKVFGSFRLAGTIGWQQRGRSNDSLNVPSLVCQNSIGKGAPA